ncbi:MAG TPA: hypothetical protein PKE29_15170 [Phycisphaerales bacterium]|mgnify:CR=1 FL=1|nr:hypothetical protein [Phycisphaerales bacterium]
MSNFPNIPETPTPPPVAGAPGPPPAPEQTARRIADWLRSIRTGARAMLVAQRAGWIVAFAVLGLVFGGFADYFLRAPMQLRLAGLLLALGVLVWFKLHYLLPAFRFRPRLTEIALRVESTRAGGDAHIRGLLASGLELGRHLESLPAPALAAPVVAQAADRLTAIRARDVFSPRPTLRGVGAGLAALALLLGLMATYPTQTRTGLARMLWPIGDAEWPKRTEIAGAMSTEIHPIGAALEFRALLLRSDRDAERTNIAVHYRVVESGSAGAERTALLTVQPRWVETTRADGSGVRAPVFERLLEPTGLSAAQSGSSGRTAASTATTELEYWFESDDDATPRKRILLVEPPAVVHATATISLPTYAAALLGAAAPDLPQTPQTLDLGAGSDERAAPAPILAGSRIILTIELNKPVPLPRPFDPTGAATRAWLASTLGADAVGLFTGGPSEAAGVDPHARLASDASGRMWTLTWQHWDSLRFTVRPTDEYQIAAGEDAVFRFDALKDNAPTATVTAPLEDKSVLPTAVVEIAGEGRDDVALAYVALERQLARRVPGSESPVPEATAERVEIIRLLAADAPAPAGLPDQSATPSVKRLVSTTTLDLSSIPDLQAGDELWITALAADAFDLDGRKHEPVRSSIRKLRILSREQLVEQIWSELSTLRRNAIKIDQDQAEIAKGRPPAGPASTDASARAERAQAGLTERLARQNQAVARLRQRARENGLTDRNVADVLKNASETLARAGADSAWASKSLGEASREQAQEAARPDAGEKELADSAEAQQSVRDELTGLIDMLDQGEDAFASKRSVERMLEQQKALRDRTESQGRQTAGKAPEDLSSEEQGVLEKIAQDQKALADALRDAVKKMQERQSKVRDKDPAAAEAMAQAAAQALRDQTAERMDQASQQAQQNQTSGAQQQQQQAIRSLEQMLDRMQKAQNNRDEVLKRALASLIDSIKGLIDVQTVSIGALKDAAKRGPTEIAALERPMVLHHQNTLGVLEQAAAVREAAKVADLLEEAATAIAASIPTLRDADSAAALGHELGALDKLNAALELAQKLDQNAEKRQNERKRAELRQKYEEAARAEAGIRDSAQGLVGVEDNRRNKSIARRLSEEQNTLRATVDQIRKDTDGLADARVFTFAHDRLDALMTGAAATLAEGTSDAPVVRAQTSAARLLMSLAEALDDRKQDEEAFREGQQSGGGGEGGGAEQPVVPDAAELVLLRLMQLEALDLARSAADAPKRDEAMVSDAAVLQDQISTQAAGLLKRLMERRAGPGPAKATPKPEGMPEGDKPAKPEGEGAPQ